MATNLVVGTKGVSSSSTTPKLRKRDDNNPRSAPMVTEYTRSIRYNWLFAIPAFIALAFIILVTLLTFLFICIGRAGPRSIRKSLAQTSAGRIMAAALYPQHIARDSKRKDWLNSAGLRMVDFSGQMPVRGENGDGSVFVNPGGSGRGNYIPLQSAGVGRNLGQQSPFLEAKDQWSNGVSPVSSSHGQPHPGPYFPPGQVQG